MIRSYLIHDMCEFKVMLSNGKIVAKDIIKLTLKDDNTLVMYDITGKTYTVKNVIIRDVDVSREEVILKEVDKL